MAIPDGGATVAPSGDLDRVVGALRRAIELSARGLGRTSPNPAVGCILLDPAGEVVGHGWHERAGGPHAEIAALADASVDAPPRAVAGGTAVVTLEPCAHAGRTGPCTQALLNAGIARVVYAVADPVYGGGAEALHQAGVQVHGPGSRLVPDTLATEAAAMNQAWLTAQRTGRPHVTWKFAATLDGRSAAVDGTSRWITGEAARADVHRLRDTADAVLVGAGTQRADDPQLTVRPAPADGRQPLRVVLDPTGGTRPGARVLDRSAPTMLVLAAGASPLGLPSHVLTEQVPRRAPGALDLEAVLALLHECGIRSVLLEGGPRLAGAFLAARLVDRVVAYLAPALLGAGPAALAEAGVGTIAQAHHLEPTDVRVLGPDVRIAAQVRAQEDQPTTAKGTTRD
ncbi:bifunctional diaminohydroxyphosphoribosylaminopyrimidine deaminase/5-amino-6-(5-phosphoribosylamino)uracil reductase RibD [Ruania zhangjianzhongii]|uniref:bifunctional diaminohydroxyphosphoribosylaminopyrimidine deaminase/5-amino-6-(5-phosphoribosylamino)uracil reductase RibD n=1 Tax=Ruania zhangjianzhongii TaxID=2603206 RepID=UPI001F01716E|nr:bifunctional diaminohydroxyphosphoribosylaminopyrimidine deaminase/5-amino-6-(5-phosphoribosylamino)uracil reductase RibD [Ruania zhangjianzhongii]